MLKLLLLSPVLATVYVVALEPIIRAVGESVIWIAAVTVALGVVWRTVIKPFWKFSRRAGRAVDQVLDLEHLDLKGSLDAIRDRLESIEGRLEPLEALDRRAEARRAIDAA